MNSSSKAQAQQRVNQISSFREEIKILQEESVAVLTQEQSAQIESYHETLLQGLGERFDVDLNSQATQLSLGMKAISFLGAIALAASVFFLFYQFWGRFSTMVQVIVLIAAPLLLYAGTVIIGQRDRTGYFVKLFASVAFASFVLNLLLLGRIFNITPTDNALPIWAALALVLAYSFDVRLLLGAGIICLIGFLSARTGTVSGMYWLGFGSRPENFLLAGGVMFLVPLIISHQRFSGFESIYRVFGLLAIMLPVLILANYGVISYLPIPDNAIEALYQVAGFVLSGLAIWIGIRLGWTDTMNTGVIFFVIFLYTKFYDWWWEIMPKYLFFLLIGLASILLLLVFKRLRQIRNSQPLVVSA